MNHTVDRSAALPHNASLLSRITLDHRKMWWQALLRGMRIRVSDLLEMMGEGVSTEEILADFPDLEREDILASLQFAARRSDISCNLPHEALGRRPITSDAGGVAIERVRG